MLRSLLSIAAICAFALSSHAQEVEAAAPADAAAEPAAEAAPAPRVAVFLPEQLEGEWYWISGTGARHLAQAAVEKAFLRAGFEVIDLGTAMGGLEGASAIEILLAPEQARSRAASAGADYLVSGKATATRASEGAAYGVTVIRARSELTARVVRVADGKVLAVEDATAEAGGQGVRAAGQEAIKKASGDLARKLVRGFQDALAKP